MDIKICFIILWQENIRKAQPLRILVAFIWIWWKTSYIDLPVSLSFWSKKRSLISYHFCDTYSEKQEDYLNAVHYNNSGANKKKIAALIAILDREAKKSTDHAYVVYQRKTYGNVPMWVIMKTLTFGQMSKMYSFWRPVWKRKLADILIM